MVDGRGHDVVGLQNFEDATGGMQLGEVVVDADGDHHGVEVLDLGNGFVIFGAINFDGETNGTLGELEITHLCTKLEHKVNILLHNGGRLKLLPFHSWRQHR